MEKWVAIGEIAGARAITPKKRAESTVGLPKHGRSTVHQHRSQK